MILEKRLEFIEPLAEVYKVVSGSVVSMSN